MRKTFYAKEKKYVILHPTFFILSIFIIYQRRKFTIITSKPKIVFDALWSMIKDLIRQFKLLV